MDKFTLKKLLKSALLLFVALNISCVQAKDLKVFNADLPNTFTYDDLVTLSKFRTPRDETLALKLKRALSTPIIDNTIAPDNQTLNEEPGIGKYIRVASWNIERGFNLDNIDLLFTNPDEMFKKIKKVSPKKEKIVRQQIEILKNTDIFILNEVDIGMPRTYYKNVAEELAKKFDYNYAYGVEFVEVDPSHLGLGNNRWSEENLLFPNTPYKIDKTKYKGLHGTAILSRFKLSNVRILRLPDGYDWFEGEHENVSHLEVFKRNAASAIFKEGVIREIRQGGRIALIADAQIPGMDKPVTIVALHLENRAVPLKRRDQMDAVLSEIAPLKNPVVMGGDLNTMTEDATPTSVRREIKKRITDPEFLIKKAVMYTNPYSMIISPVLDVSTFARKYRDPTVKSIPVFFPNKERKLFVDVQKQKFADNNQFDFRGDKMFSPLGRYGNLSNSNERKRKGFKPTFVFERTVGVGKYKLDWLFVKGDGQYLDDKKTPSYKLSPVFGRTLFTLNHTFKDLLSDHAPITVDIPIDEPDVNYFKKKHKHKK